jgi:hypothetical protein
MTDNKKQTTNYFGLTADLFDVGTKIYDNMSNEPEIEEVNTTTDGAVDTIKYMLNTIADTIEDHDTENDDTENNDTENDVTHGAIDEIRDMLSAAVNSVEDVAEDDDTEDDDTEDSVAEDYDTEDEYTEDESFDTMSSVFGAVANTARNYVTKNVSAEKSIKHLIKGMIMDVDPESTNENNENATALLFQYLDTNYNVNEIGEKLLKRTIEKVNVEEIIARNISVTNIVKSYTHDNWASMMMIFSLYILFHCVLICMFT